MCAHNLRYGLFVSRQHVALKVAEFDQITTKAGLTSDYARARRIGCSHTTILRLRQGKPAGGKFIAAALEALNVKFEDIFERKAT